MICQFSSDGRWRELFACRWILGFALGWRGCHLDWLGAYTVQDHSTARPINTQLISD